MKTITKKIRQHLLYRKCKQCGGKVVIDERRTNYEAFLGPHYYHCESCQQYYALTQLRLCFYTLAFTLAYFGIPAIIHLAILYSFSSEIIAKAVIIVELVIFSYLLIKVMPDLLLKPVEKPQTIYDNKPNHQADSISKSIKNLTVKEKIILSLFTLSVVAVLIYLIKYLR